MIAPIFCVFYIAVVLRLIAAVALFLSLAGESLASAPTRLRTGRYGGYLYLPSAGMKLAAVLDTIHIPANPQGKPKLAAYLKLSFGGFRSHEYLTHFFLVPDYDWDAEEMILDAATSGTSRDITANTRISADGSQIAGEVTSLRGGISNAELELRFLSPSHLWEEGLVTLKQFSVDLREIYKEIPIFPLLTGSYSSSSTFIKTLQLELTKSSSLSRASVVPMEGYEARGRVLGIDPLLESSAPSVLRSLNSFPDFIYNFYRAELDFSKVPILGKCRRTPSAIECDGARFVASPEEKPFLEALVSGHCSSNLLPYPTLEQRAGQPITGKTLSASLSKVEYSGYLHFEERDLVRPFVVGVNVTGAPVPGDPTIQKRILSFLPRLYEQGAELPATGQFTPLDVSSTRLETDTPQRIVLVGNGDLLEIERWTDQAMVGVYYSEAFGRVGTFFVSRAPRTPAVSQRPLLPGTLLGEIQTTDSRGEKWFQHQLNLHWVTNPKGFPGPYTLGGTFSILWETLDSVSARNTIASFPLENVRYDPFTGVMGADMNFVPDLTYYSLIAKFDSDRAHLVFNNNTPTFEPLTNYHRVFTLRRDQKYGQVVLPDTAKLSPHRLHLFLPFDAALEINGTPMKEQLGSNHRQFAFPASLPADKAVTYHFRFKPSVGPEISHRLTFKPGDYQKKPLILNFYQLQP